MISYLYCAHLVSEGFVLFLCHESIMTNYVYMYKDDKIYI